MSPKFSDEEIAWLDEKVSSRGEASEELRSHLREWHPFDPKRLEQCRRLGIPVFVDFTASWCLLCQTNQLLIDGELVSRRMEELGMVKMKADWTKRDAKIAEWLRRLGRSGVPLYLLFTGEGDPQILPQLLTTDLLLEALEGVAKP